MGPRVIQNGDVGVANLLISSSLTCISPSRNPSVSLCGFKVSVLTCTFVILRHLPISGSSLHLHRAKRSRFVPWSCRVSLFKVEQTEHLALLSLHGVDLTSYLGLGLGLAVLSWIAPSHVSMHWMIHDFNTMWLWVVSMFSGFVLTVWKSRAVLVGRCVYYSVLKQQSPTGWFGLWLARWECKKSSQT